MPLQVSCSHWLSAWCPELWLPGVLQFSHGKGNWAHPVALCGRSLQLQVQFGSPDVGLNTGSGASRPNWSWLDDSNKPRRSAGYEHCVTAETVKELCQQGYHSEAVEALGFLVETDGCVSRSLLYYVLKGCLAKKDVVLARRVHGFTVKTGHGREHFLCNHILRMYASHGTLQDAVDVFTMVARPDAFMWSSIISAHVKHGQEEQALQLYHQMCISGVKADGHVFVAALQACARVGDLKFGQELHADVLASGTEPDLFVCSCLVDMYAKCGSLEDAQRVFDGLGRKDVVIWNAMIAGYARQGMSQDALRLFRDMEGEGCVVPNSITFLCLLQACASVGRSALEMGKQIHGRIRERGYEADVFVANSLVTMYAKCGSLEYAQQQFEGLVKKDVVTWNAMIAGYSQQGLGLEALRLYSAMQDEGVVAPDSVTFVSLLQACACLGSPALETGKQLHVQIREQGHQAHVVVTNSLLNMYAKCGSLADARKVFDGLVQKGVVTWNAMMSGYSQQGMGQEALRLYCTMQEEGMAAPDSVTFVSLLQACASLGHPALDKGKELHELITKRGYQNDAFVGNSLVNMYAKCGSLEGAQRIFNGLDEKSVVTWNAMMAGYSQQGKGHEALWLYTVMLEEGITSPDSATFVCLLQACATVGTPALETGKQLHAKIRERGHEVDLSVANSLINMYAKCGSLEDARRVFEGLGRKDVVTWNAMIAGYSQLGMGREALLLNHDMEEEGISVPDCVTFVCLLQACASLGTQALDMGKQLHAQIKKRGHQADVFVANGLVSMYAKCGSLEHAQRVFDELVLKDVVTWNAIITGYSQQGMGQEALRLYTAMQEGITIADSLTYVCLLQACADVAALDLGRRLHAQIEEQGLQGDVVIVGSLINMYGKSGSIVDAQQIFDAMPDRDVVMWSALIAGYTCQGNSEAVFDLVQRMEEDGIQPDSITFLSLLTVCSHANLVNKGREYLGSMSRHYDMTPTVEHYTCMVDLLGRAGRLDDALALVSTMAVLPNSGVWHSLLGACQKWKNLEVGRHAFEQAVGLDRKDAAAYVLMSNIYTGVQMWDQADEILDMRNAFRVWKQPGQSWWTDMDGQVHSFLAGTKAHPDG